MKKSTDITVLPAAPESQGRDLVNQLLGQAQAFQAAGDLLRTFGVSKLAIVKENKLYQQLAGMKTPNGSELKGTWAEFCGLLGVSDDKANEDIANLQAFGEVALEQMQRIGIGYRDLRQFRRLPTDQRTALIEAAKEGDKDSFLELAEDLVLSHEREKASLVEETETLTKSRAKLSADLEISQNEVKRLSKARPRLTNFHPRTEAVRAECLALQAEAELPLSSLEKLLYESLNEDVSEEKKERVSQVLVTLQTLFARAVLTFDRARTYGFDLPSLMPARVESAHIMTAEEASQWVRDYNLILNQHEAKKAMREARREAEAPRGRGRPKASAEAERA